MNRRWPMILGVVAVACIVGVLWFFQARGNADEKLSPLPERTPEQEQADRIRVEVEGQELDLESLNLSESGWTLFVSGEAEGTDLVAILKQVADLFTGLHRLNFTLADVGILLRTSDLKDAYGNTLKDLPIVEIGLSKDTMERIDWDGFEPKNFERVADRYWVHDEIQKMADEKAKAESGGGGGGGGSGGGGGGGASQSSSTGG